MKWSCGAFSVLYSFLLLQDYSWISTLPINPSIYPSIVTLEDLIKRSKQSLLLSKSYLNIVFVPFFVNLGCWISYKYISVISCKLLTNKGYCKNRNHNITPYAHTFSFGKNMTYELFCIYIKYFLLSNSLLPHLWK